MSRVHLSLLLLPLIVNAQLPLEVPTCAIPCVNDYLASTPCAASNYDLGCVCNDTSAAGLRLATCVFDLWRCSSYDLVAFSEGLYYMCPQLFTSVVLGGASATSTPHTIPIPAATPTLTPTLTSTKTVYGTAIRTASLAASPLNGAGYPGTSNRIGPAALGFFLGIFELAGYFIL